MVANIPLATENKLTASSVQGECKELFSTVLLCCCFLVDFYLLVNHLLDKKYGLFDDG